MTEVEIIEGMLNILDCDEHWCKGLLQDDGGTQHCLMGAFNLTVSNITSYYYRFSYTPEEHTVIETLAALAVDRGYGLNDERIPLGLRQIVEFNNAPETTWEDVRLLLKEALERVS
jgi:hypothetical protein